MDIGSESQPRRRGRARFNSLAGKLVASRTFERRVASSLRFRPVTFEAQRTRFGFVDVLQLVPVSTSAVSTAFFPLSTLLDHSLRQLS